MAETAVFEAVSVRVMAERTEVNMGIFTRYLAWVKLNEFVGQVDGEVAEKRPEGKTGDPLRSGSGCPSVDAGDFSAIVAIATAVGAAVAVAVPLLSDVLW